MGFRPQSKLVITISDDCKLFVIKLVLKVSIDYFATFSHKSNITAIKTDGITCPSSCDVIKRDIEPAQRGRHDAIIV